MKANPRGDQELARDYGQASRAVKALKTNALESTEELKQLAQATQVLSAAGELRIALTQLRELARRERWELDDPTAAAEHHRALDIFKNQNEKAIRLAERIGLSQELRSKLNNLRWNPTLQRATEQIQNRLWNSADPVSTAALLQETSDDLAEVLNGLEPQVKAARLALDELSPSLKDLADRAAEATAQVSQQTKTAQSENCGQRSA